jgi:hypothetical protein
VLGSDLIYSEEGAALLPHVLRAVATGGANGTTILYAHTLGRYEALDEAFLSSLNAAGLVAMEVREPWLAPPPSLCSASRFEELFPEMRVAVLAISPRSTLCHGGT